MWGEISSDIVKRVVCGERLDQVRESWTQGARSVQTLLVWGQIRSGQTLPSNARCNGNSGQVRQCWPAPTRKRGQVRSNAVGCRRMRGDVMSDQTLLTAAGSWERQGQIRCCWTPPVLGRGQIRSNTVRRRRLWERLGQMLLATAGGGETRQVGSNTVGLPKSRVRWDTAGRLAMGGGGAGGRTS